MNTKQKKGLKRKDREKGFVLAVSVIVMACLLLLALPFLSRVSTENKNAKKTSHSFEALSLAEAGVERAIWELNYGDISGWEGDSSLRTMPLPDFQSSEGKVMGDIEIRIENPEGDNPVIEATGRITYEGSKTISRTARVVLKRDGPPPIFDFAIFGDEGVEMSSNAQTDSYDSREGEYGGTNVNENGNVGTNATHYGCISLNANARIYGDAYSGPQSDPDAVIITRSNAFISGEKRSLPQPKAFPSVLAPSGLPYKGYYSLGSNKQDTISQSGEYSSFRLSSNSTVIISADVTLYVTGDFSLSSNSRLEIAEGVTATIYIGGTFTQRSNSQINNLSKDPAKLLILGTDSLSPQIEWKSNSQFWGAVYVPGSSVDFRSNSDFHGAVIAKSLTINSNARIHYDEALASVNIEVEEDDFPFAVKSWQQKFEKQF